MWQLIAIALALFIVPILLPRGSAFKIGASVLSLPFIAFWSYYVFRQHAGNAVYDGSNTLGEAFVLAGCYILTWALIFGFMARIVVRGFLKESIAMKNTQYRS